MLGEKATGGRVWSVLCADIRVIEFPELPQGLITRPTLNWILEDSTANRHQTVEVSYLTSGLSWNADYVAVINDKDDAYH